MKNRIVVGHGISNDFEALMLNHPKKLIRDTATYDPLMYTNGAVYYKQQCKLTCRENDVLTS